MPLVTIVVPTYDRLRYLREAPESVRAQTFTDYEVLIANDAGPADLSTIQSEFRESNFVFLRRTSNLGIASNIWAAFSEAKTRYVTTLNDDDLWQPHFLEVLVAGLEEHPTASVAFCDIWHIGANGETWADETDIE